MEIWQTLQSLPGMAILTAAAFWLEVRGYSKIYDTTEEGPGMWYNILQFPIFLLFTDFFIYWIHRGLHHPRVYKHLHKPHHKWIMPTPFASHAFHPLDGFAQSIPYHVFPFVLPLQKFAYIALFVFINIWTVMIHDGEYVANSPIINGAACHTMHHLYCKLLNQPTPMPQSLTKTQSTTIMDNSQLCLTGCSAATGSRTTSSSKRNQK
jgi:lathosterol oxidase